MLDLIVVFSKIVSWVFKIYSWAHIIAFMMSWISADANNSFVSFVYRITHPLWHWVGERIPMKLNAFAPIFALMLVIYGEVTVPGVVRSLGAMATSAVAVGPGMMNVLFYAIFGALYITNSIIGFILLLAIIWFVITLVNPPLNNPLVRSIMYLVDPMITPLQRVLPRARIDLSPIVLAIIAFLAREGIYRLMLPIQTHLII